MGTTQLPDLVSRYALSDEQRELKEQVRRWADEKLAPIAAQVDKDNEFPAPIWKGERQPSFFAFLLLLLTLPSLSLLC